MACGESCVTSLRLFGLRLEPLNIMSYVKFSFPKNQCLWKVNFSFGLKVVFSSVIRSVILSIQTIARHGNLLWEISSTTNFDSSFFCDTCTQMEDAVINYTWVLPNFDGLAIVFSQNQFFSVLILFSLCYLLSSSAYNLFFTYDSKWSCAILNSFWMLFC